MRLQHLTQIAGNLSSDKPERAAAKAAIVEEVERLRWRLWNGKAKDAGISIDRIRAVMRHFQGEADGRRSVAPSSKLWTALRALNDYLTGQSAWLVDYAERHRAGRRGRHGADRGHGQLPGEPPDGQIAADALVPARRRPAAPGPLRRLQRHARHRLRATLPSRQRSEPASRHRGLNPQSRDGSICWCSRRAARPPAKDAVGRSRPKTLTARTSERRLSLTVFSRGRQPLPCEVRPAPRRSQSSTRVLHRGAWVPSSLVGIVQRLAGGPD